MEFGKICFGRDPVQIDGLVVVLVYIQLSFYQPVVKVKVRVCVLRCHYNEGMKNQSSLRMKICV